MNDQDDSIVSQFLGIPTRKITFGTNDNNNQRSSIRSRRQSYVPSSRDVEHPDEKATCYDHVEEFSQCTTLHGIRYIAQRDSFVLRRLIWLVLTVAFSTLLVLQINDRVSYFYQSPITVNFKVNYNQSLQFPAITVCNQNAFRSTQASHMGLYRLVENMYKDGHHGNETSWINVTRSDLPMDKLLLDLGHQKNDFIVRCVWAGELCSADDFTVTLTDHGLCYTFNRELPQHVRNVSFSGVEHGLRLTLNAEQYEAMPGPHDATGIKMLTTDQSEFPRVEEIGIAIPAGVHAFVGLGVLVINNLPKPHGDCGTRPLVSTSRYTAEICTLECIARHIYRRCGCRHFYMPEIYENTPVCTIAQYFECYIEAYEYLHKHVRTTCDCPTSCNYMIYEPTISYATTSKFMQSYILDDIMSTGLKKRFYEARETTHRRTEGVFRGFTRVVKQASLTFDRLKHVLSHDIHDRLTRQMDKLIDVKKNMTFAINKKSSTYRYQKYAVQKNFMRARDAMEERTLNMVCLGFHEHVFDTEFKLRHMYEARRQNSSEADMLYILLKNTLRSRIETGTRALANYTQLYEAYEIGQKIFNYKYYNHARSDNDAIVPKHLLNSSLVHNVYARKYAPRVGEDIEKVLNATEAFEAFVDKVYFNFTDDLDILRMNKLSYAFLSACELFFHSKSTFYFETVDRPLRILETRYTIFNNLKLEYQQSLTNLDMALQILNSSLTDIRFGFLERLAFDIEIAKVYVTSNPEDFANGTKLQLARVFTSKNMSDNLHAMVLFLNDMRYRGQTIYEYWDEITSWCLKIWKKILTDKDSLDYYQHKQIDIFLQQYSNYSLEFKEDISEIRDDNDLRFILGTLDNEFHHSIDALIKELKAFLEGNKMDDTFVRDNFLQLDVYFKELRHEQIDQQKAYDEIALLCDIGGSLGLFIGASAMTLFEVIDFIANKVAEWCLYRRNKKQDKDIHESSRL